MKLRRYGFSWSWKRAFGISGMRTRVAHYTGIPTTRSGVQRKIGRAVINALLMKK